MTARHEYLRRLAAREQACDQLRRSDDRAANVRVAAFAVGLACVFAVFGSWKLPLYVLLLPAALFVAAVVYHVAVQRKQQTARRAIEHYERCLRRVDGAWPQDGPTGDEFSDPTHPYAGDLDVFGAGSLYQLLGSPVTPSGLRMLADWLAPAAGVPLPSADAIVARQGAVGALRDELDLRERLAVIGPAKKSPTGDKELHQWLADAGGLTGAAYPLAAALLGVAGVATMAYWFTTQWMAPFIFVVLLQLIFVRWLREPLESIKKHSEHAVDELRRTQQVFAMLESPASPRHPELVEEQRAYPNRADADPDADSDSDSDADSDDAELSRLRNELTQDNVRASEAIRRITRIVSQYENARRNIAVAPLAFVSMMNVQLAAAIDRWRATHGARVDRWFQAAGELETLLAFAQLHYENPDYCFPKLADSPTPRITSPCFVATQLAHPLLHADEAVANDVSLNDECRLLLVSGSNMSGKSTLLRSVGVNAALAWAGAPVFAESLTLSPLRVAAAMRMHDSLQTGTSHFMAELKRIRLVVTLAEQNSVTSVPVLFLLDEILHGTNSHDRLVGARGVIRSLLKAGAIGLVTTHDLALSDMVEELDAELNLPAHNVHFTDQWRDSPEADDADVGGQMTFDYKMRDGVVPKGNALSLMRLLGLDV